MTDHKERVRRLLALAVNPTTPVEEARTASMAAVRLIESRGMLGCSPENFFSERPVQHCPGCRCYSNIPEPPPPPPPSERKWRADFDDNPEAEEVRRYREGWEYIWGTGGVRRPGR